MYWDLEMFLTSRNPADIEFARQEYQRLWSSAWLDNHMWVLLVILRAFLSHGYRAKVKPVPGCSHEYYIVGQRKQDRWVVRYVPDQSPLFNIYTLKGIDLRTLAVEENADRIVLAIRSLFDDRSQILSRRQGLLLWDGFNMLDLLESTKVPDDAMPSCPKCGALLELGTSAASPDGIAWFCTRSSSGSCDAHTLLLAEIL